MGVSGNFREFFSKKILEISRKFSRISPEISGMTGNFNMVFCIHSDKIIDPRTRGLHKKTTIMSNSPAEFLKKCDLSQFSRVFLTPSSVIDKL